MSIDLRITIEDIEDADAGELMLHLEEIGLMAEYEQRSARNPRGWAPFIPEVEA